MLEGLQYGGGDKRGNRTNSCEVWIVLSPDETGFDGAPVSGAWAARLRLRAWHLKLDDCLAAN